MQPLLTTVLKPSTKQTLWLYTEICHLLTKIRHCYQIPHIQKCILYIFPFIVLLSQYTNAHVRWFINTPVNNDASYPLDGTIIIVTIGGILYTIACVLLERYSRHNTTIAYLLHKEISWHGVEWDILKGSIVILLIGNMLSHIFLAPNLSSSEIGYSLSILLQATVIVCLVFSDFLFSLALLALTIIIVIFFGFSLAIDYAAELIAFAISFTLLATLGNTRARQLLKQHSDEDIRQWAFKVLRIGLGIQLIILAWHNKLLDPSLGLFFLEERPYFNFMTYFNFFPDFENIYFVFSAGIAETCFGLLLITGFSCRLVSLCVLFCFTVTSFILGAHELIGHLPILAAVLILFLGPTKAHKPSASPLTQDKPSYQYAQ